MAKVGIITMVLMLAATTTTYSRSMVQFRAQSHATISSFFFFLGLHWLEIGAVLSFAEPFDGVLLFRLHQ